MSESTAALEKKIEEVTYENECLKKNIKGLIEHSNSLLKVNDQTIDILFSHIDIIGNLTTQLKRIEEEKEIEAQNKQE